MYDMMELILAVIMVLLGIFTIAFPKQSTKKQYRDDSARVEKVRKTGIVWKIF